MRLACLMKKLSGLHKTDNLRFGFLLMRSANSEKNLR